MQPQIHAHRVSKRDEKYYNYFNALKGYDNYSTGTVPVTRRSYQLGITEMRILK